jgi:hypothetical protein
VPSAASGNGIIREPSGVTSQGACSAGKTGRSATDPTSPSHLFHGNGILKTLPGKSARGRGLQVRVRNHVRKKYDWRRLSLRYCGAKLSEKQQGCPAGWARKIDFTT